MIRLLGAFLLSLGGIELARLLAARERERLGVAEAYLELLRYLRGELHAFARPLCEVFLRYENEALEKNGLLPRLRAGCGFAEAVGQTSSPHDPALREILTAFGRAVGRGYLAETLATCDVYIERLDDYVRQVREAVPMRIRLRRTVTLTGTALVLLLLI